MLAERSPDSVVLNSFMGFSRPFKKPWCFSQHEVTEEEIENVERATIRQASDVCNGIKSGLVALQAP